MLDYQDFIKWASDREPQAFQDFIKSDALNDIFNERLEVDRVYSTYLPPLTFRRYLYSDVMHHFILESDIAETDALKSLYAKYEVAKQGNMLLTSASDSSTSGSMFIPSRLNESDLGMLRMYLTPYGRVVEGINQQLVNIVI